MKKVEMITITKKEYDNLIKRNFWLACLEAAGVDNWDGYDIAAFELQEYYIKNTC